jgi:hypothetical protein
MTGSFSDVNYSSSTVFAVMRVGGTDGNGWAIQVRPSSGSAAWVWQSRVAFDTSRVSGPLLSYVSPTRVKAPLLLATSGQTGSFFDATFNDAFGTSGATSAGGTNATLFDMGYDPGTLSSTDIAIFEFIVYNRVLTSGEYANVMSYLKTKYQYNTW